MQSFKLLYRQDPLKLILQLAILCFLLSSTQPPLAAAETILAEKISSAKKIREAQEFNIRLTPNEKAWLEKNPEHQSSR